MPCLWQFISIQLDCDRLDYLMLDSYMTGVSYGQLDLDRILLALQVDPKTQQLVVARKGLGAIEHYLVVRSFMYSQVYNHGKNIAATWLLDRAFTRARDLLAAGQELVIDETVLAWLNAKEVPMALADYLAGDDTVFQYHLQRWQANPDPILSDLCRRYCDRDLFKAREVSHLGPAEQQERFHQAQQEMRTIGLDPQYYTGFRVARSKGYALYQKGIKLQQDGELTEISEVSPLVKTIATTQERAWVVAVERSD
jgi:HD superfamily phosphohydrolase